MKKVNISKCPLCRVKLGDFIYADACPHCHKELAHNRRPTLATTKADPGKENAWAVRLFTRFVRFVES